MIVQPLSSFKRDIKKLKDATIKLSVFSVIEEMEKKDDPLSVTNTQKISTYKYSYRTRVKIIE